MSHNFDRFNSFGTYTCEICHKLTRETGHDESFVKQCAFCWQEGGMENSLSDGHITQEEFDTKHAALCKQYNRISTL